MADIHIAEARAHLQKKGCFLILILTLTWISFQKLKD